MEMGETKYNYTAKFKQPQKVGNISLDPKGGVLTEREIKAIKKDRYGASLIEKNLLVIGDEVTANPDPKPDGSSGNGDETKPEGGAGTGTETGSETGTKAEDTGTETIPDLDKGLNHGYEGKKDSPDQEHAGWKPE